MMICDMCGHNFHSDDDCEEITGYDHINGDHCCECPGSLLAQLAMAWDEGHGTSNGGCVYWPDCAEIGDHINPYQKLFEEEIANGGRETTF